MFLVKESWGF